MSAAWTSSQSPRTARPPASTALTTLKVARSTTPARQPAAAQAASYCATTSRRATLTTNSCAPAVVAPGSGRHHRLVERERRRLLDLPANQLVEVGAAGRHGLEAHQADAGNRIGHDQGHPPGADASIGQRPRHRRPDPGQVGHVRRRQRAADRALGQRLDRVRGQSETAAALLDAGHGDPPGCDVHGDVRRRRLEERGQVHSTKVTLLISRSVVSPSITRSTADSRRKRIP